jgi:hypothetical protein
MPNNYTKRTQPNNSYSDRTTPTTDFDERLDCSYDPTWDEADIMWNNMDRSWDSLDSCPTYDDRNEPTSTTYTDRVVPNNTYTKR